MKIHRILHAGYLFEDQGVKILFDPIFENPFSVNCYAYPSVDFNYELLQNEIFDAVFISHIHDDHFSFESLKWIDRQTPIYIHCLHTEVLDLFIQMNFKNVRLIEINRSIECGPFSITPRRALDADIDCLFQIQSGNINVLNVVDSWIDYSTLELLQNQKPWDVILWPFQNFREIEVLAPHVQHPIENEYPKEWTEQLQKLSPQIIIPSSCQFQFDKKSWLNSLFFLRSYDDFLNWINKSTQIQACLQLDPGSCLQLTKMQNKLQHQVIVNQIVWLNLFVNDPVNQTNDYEFNLQTVVRSLEAQSATYPVLSASQIVDIESYLQNEFVDAYNSLEVFAELGFSNQHLWQLKIVLAENRSLLFSYKIENNSLFFIDRQIFNKWSDQADWITEIIGYKFYCAWKNAESLTSLYLRINNNQRLWDKMLDRDSSVFADPLLRVFYENKLFSYQKSQIRQILNLNSI